MLTREDWHRRFQQQAEWTLELRRYLYRQTGLENVRRILEVGCGTGAVTASIHADTPARVFGIDIDLDRLILARQTDPDTDFSSANGLALPFSAGTFDVTICHFYFLWVKQAGQAAMEMARVTRPGGAVMVLAEPDYGGRVDYPEDLAEMGRLQELALRRQGADPRAGRKAASLLVRAGLVDVRGGVLGGQWNEPLSADARSLEWDILENDLRGTLSEEDFSRLRDLDQGAWARRERILFVPTFYAWGKVLQ